MSFRENLKPYKYSWPPSDFKINFSEWKEIEDSNFLYKKLEESDEQLNKDSRWPAIFPSSIGIVTTGNDDLHGMERIVGATIVNRFPYILALSFCTKNISNRHYPRNNFLKILESSKNVALQFFPPGHKLDKVLNVISNVSDEDCNNRILETSLKTRKAISNDTLVFQDAFLVYEAKLVNPRNDFSGNKIFENFYQDIGSHRVYFFEISTIQIDEQIAKNKNKIFWKSLPIWNLDEKFKQESSSEKDKLNEKKKSEILKNIKYAKAYNPEYSFPSENTVSFEHDSIIDGMAIRKLPPDPSDQVEVDNDRARWPCFFPSSLGMITTITNCNSPSAMPCGSVMVVSRHPFTIAMCISYSEINERYAKRYSLDAVIENGWFGCGIPYVNEKLTDAITYLGNVSFEKDKEKILNSGLTVKVIDKTPILLDFPVHFECKLTNQIRLGTHFMLFGEVKTIYISNKLTEKSSLEWCPFADVGVLNE